MPSGIFSCPWVRIKLMTEQIFSYCYTVEPLKRPPFSTVLNSKWYLMRCKINMICKDCQENKVRVSSGQGNSRLGKSQGKVKEFCWRSGKKMNIGKSQGKVREFAFSAIYVVKNYKKSQNSLSLQSIQFWRLSLCTILWKFKSSNFVFW